MKHVIDRLAARAGGELSGPEAEAVTAHLESCRECRLEADRLQQVWEMLGQVAPCGERPSADLWGAVQARTFGRAPAGWFFGRSPLARLGLAVATVAMGVLIGRLTGGVIGPLAAGAEDDTSLAGVWLEESAWHGDAPGGLADSWLAVAGAGDQAVGTGQGGTR